MGQTRLILLPGLLVACLAPGLGAAELDASKLPPPANVQVDFTRDVKPLLQASCLRCHGPERPKSAFRLDNRERALRGGDQGVDIVPGRSSESPLVYFAAQVVAEMEMPPEGKGEPLTGEQVGVLRAWIDQGANWEAQGTSNLLDATVSPTFGGVAVSGNQQQFREHYWQRDGLNGGLERFEIFQQRGPDTTVSLEGHALVDDYRIRLDVNKNDLGFVHLGWDQYRQYYNNLGGSRAPPSTQGPPTLGRDLFLDLGKAWVDFGLTLPRWPSMVLGYEYDYRRGQEASTSWGSDGVPGDPRNVAPNSIWLDEGTHVVKFQLDAQLSGISLEDRFRGEFYQLSTHYTNLAARGSIAQNANSSVHYFQGANSIRLEKKIKKWLLASGGYFFSKLNSDESFADATTANASLYLAAVPNLMLSRESHVFNLNGLLGPIAGLDISVGAQAEWTRQEGVGSGDLNQIAYSRPPNRNLVIDPATLAANYDQSVFSETAGLRYTKLPYTTLFADSRWQQQNIGQSAGDLQSGGAFLEDISYESRLSDFRAGFSSSPWELASFDGHFRRYEKDSHFDTNQVAQPLGGYPGLIRRLDVITDEIEAKLVLHLSARLKTTVSYQFLTTEYNQDSRAAFDVIPPTLYSPGGPLLAGKTDSHVYSVGATLTSMRRLALTGTLSYQDSRTSSANSGAIAPYRGGVYSALASGSYSLSQSTSLSLNYSFSRADFSASNVNNDPNSPPPLGIRYQQHAVQAVLSHRLTKNLVTRLQYGFYYYDEPTSGGANNYKANAGFVTLSYHFP